jgi:hypothetical protein
MFTTLLKGAFPNLVVIESAVPRYIPTGSTGVFEKSLLMSELVLKPHDKDVQKLIQYCVDLKTTPTSELTQDICTYILNECGGHAFPTLTFIEYFFTHVYERQALVSMEAFRRRFCGPDFARSEFYEIVFTRCFDQLMDRRIKESAFRVMGGKEEVGDIDTLIHLGWWDTRTNEFLSQFLVNTCLSTIKAGSNDVVYLDEKRSEEE